MRPTADELARWLRDEAELDRRLVGTAYAPIVDRLAPAQRSGVLASLNMVADALQLLPVARQTTTTWSAAAWSKDRRGWLFLTSTPETRPRLLPLTSLWLDLLVLRLMNRGQPGKQRVWLVLDELASLQRLPQLHTAITEVRKSNNPVVLGFQGRSQLETRYGHDAEVMLSQPATKIFLRTSEPEAAGWVSKAIGDVETERLAESRSSGRGPLRPSTNYGLHRQVDPLVMPSEISGLPNLDGFLKIGNAVVRLRFAYLEPRRYAERFIERDSRPSSPLPLSFATAAGRPSVEISPAHRHSHDHGLDSALSTSSPDPHLK
jgi:type IV secretory pathway TraG/TraD family ATPase VirD4